MTKAQICIMISIVIYLVSMVMIGVVYSKKTKNVEFLKKNKKNAKNTCII